MYGTVKVKLVTVESCGNDVDVDVEVQVKVRVIKKVKVNLAWTDGDVYVYWCAGEGKLR